MASNRGNKPFLGRKEVSFSRIAMGLGEKMPLDFPKIKGKRFRPSYSLKKTFPGLWSKGPAIYKSSAILHPGPLNYKSIDPGGFIPALALGPNLSKIAPKCGYLGTESRLIGIGQIWVKTNNAIYICANGINFAHKTCTKLSTRLLKSFSSVCL
jgi:hypothetical protein